MHERNFTHEELIRLYDDASPQTQHMVFAMLRIDHDYNRNSKLYARYLGTTSSYINGVPLYTMSEPSKENDSE